MPVKNNNQDNQQREPNWFQRTGASLFDAVGHALGTTVSVQSPITPLAAVHGLIGESAYSLGRDLFRRHIGVPLRKKLGMPVKPYVRTENQVSPRFLNLTKDVIDQYLEQHPEIQEKIDKEGKATFTISGKDYNTNYGGALGEHNSLPNRIWGKNQVETTLGSFTVDATPDNYTVRDTYDFRNVHPSRAEYNPFNPLTYWPIIRSFASEHATSESAPDNEKIKFNLNINRNPVMYGRGGKIINIRRLPLCTNFP